jgi:hypothetical protein
LTRIKTWSPERNVAATLEAIRVSVARVRGSTDHERVLSHPTRKKSARNRQRQL